MDIPVRPSATDGQERPSYVPAFCQRTYERVLTTHRGLVLFGATCGFHGQNPRAKSMGKIHGQNPWAKSWAKSDTHILGLHAFQMCVLDIRFSEVWVSDFVPAVIRFRRVIT
jgi:hypothetical protein